MADVLKMPITLLTITDFECVGASLIAGAGVGVYEDLSRAVGQVVKAEKEIKPREETFKIYDRIYGLFLKTYPLLEDIFKEMANIVS